ncbi:MAG: helix-turn-helix transcriptional regulator [Anaerolineaceae bacterium]|nr:helix-turn-helix transcriptional regulator [Anaerolineaceae bacterium]
MSYKIDFSIATSDQIEAALCSRLENIRLTRNITQAQLAKTSGLSLKTIGRLERGQGVSFDTLIRVLIALGLQEHLKAFLPDPTVRPVERVSIAGTERKRARPRKSIDDHEAWSWGDETADE